MIPTDNKHHKHACQSPEHWMDMHVETSVACGQRWLQSHATHHVVALEAVAELAVVVARADAGDDGKLAAAVLAGRDALGLLQQQRPIPLHPPTWHQCCKDNFQLS